MTSVLALPAPPARRFIPAAVAVRERQGVTVVVDRQPNLCRWAVHTIAPSGRTIVLSGPAAGEEMNPSNSELAAQLVKDVKATGVEVDLVFTNNYQYSQLLRAKTTLPVSDLSAPPAAMEAARKAIGGIESGLTSGLILACDASRGRRSDMNGCGWILAYRNGAQPVIGSTAKASFCGCPRCSSVLLSRTSATSPTGSLPKSGRCRGIRAGELSAIRRGIQETLDLHPSLRTGAGDLTVLTDSKEALALLEKVRTSEWVSGEDYDSVAECQRILQLVRGANITFEWVRSHNGHPLNELADRLAVLGRRNKELEVDPQTRTKLLASIREDAKAICATL